jgi:hypothetical protein
LSASRSIRARRAAIVPIAAALAAAGAAAPASAHGFGQRYDLPLPLSLYLIGASAAVVLSFVVMALFFHRPAQSGNGRRVGHTFRLGPIAAGAAHALRFVSLVLFVLAILAGFFGDQNPYRNIAPTLVWIVLWVGGAFLSALVGNLWPLINPWRTVFDWADRLHRRLARKGELSLRRPYPGALGVWPAFLLFLVFCWIELVYPSAAAPAHLAAFAVAYSAVTWAGMFVFGPATWLPHGEIFTVVFGLLARFAPIQLRERTWTLRPYGAGLAASPPASPPMTALVLLILSTVLYDGFLSTPEWSSLEGAVAALTGSGTIMIKTLGLIAFWAAFFGAYAGICWVMSLAAGGQPGTQELARLFVFTLVPIAIGYHVAHYLVFLLIQGQYVVPLLSDPFGYGWDLFGTAGYRVDIAIVDARFAWYAAVGAIVLGHVAAVYLAHRKAMEIFDARGFALRSQVPLTALMVLYTLVSLSILAEPIVERRTPAQVAFAEITVPADAVLPDPEGGSFQAVGPGKVAKVKLTYRVLGSAFHDGTITNVADLLYAYLFAYRWGVHGEADDTSYDPYVDTATAPMRRHLAGLRVVATDATSRTFRVGDVTFARELFEIEVYSDLAPDDPERDAIVAPPWSTLPWHLVILMEEAVHRGWAAFSQPDAARRGVAWLDLVRSEELARRMTSLVETFERDGYRPPSLQSLVGADEARKRWSALADFRKAHGHFLVTNGPYRLKSWSADRVTLEAFRDLTYPLGVGSYDSYAIPRRGFVTDVQQDGGRVTLSGDIEVVEKFQRSYRLVRTPLRAIAPEVLRRSAPECRYMVVDENAKVVRSGVARLGDDARFRVDLAGELPAGSYTLAALIAVGGNAMNAEIRRIPVVVAVNQ